MECRDRGIIIQLKGCCQKPKIISELSDEFLRFASLPPCLAIIVTALHTSCDIRYCIRSIDLSIKAVLFDSILTTTASSSSSSTGTISTTTTSSCCNGNSISKCDFCSSSRKVDYFSKTTLTLSDGRYTSSSSCTKRLLGSSSTTSTSSTRYLPN